MNTIDLLLQNVYPAPTSGPMGDHGYTEEEMAAAEEEFSASEFGCEEEV